MNIFKRIFAGILVCMMLVTVLPSSVFADVIGQEVSYSREDSTYLDETSAAEDELADSDSEYVSDSFVEAEDSTVSECISEEPVEDGEVEDIAISESFTVQELVDAVVSEDEETKELQTKILSVTMQDNSAVVTYMSDNDGSINVYLVDEDDAQQIHLAEGVLDVLSTQEEMKVEVPLTLLMGDDMPSNFIIVAEITDVYGENFRLVSDEYTRFRQGIETSGFAFLDEYDSGNHLYGTENNYILYSQNVVVVSEEETAALTITQSAGSYTLNPMPTQIREMTDDEAAQITGIVFILPGGEHRVVKINQGSLVTSVESNTPVVSFEAAELDYSTASIEDFAGLLSAVHLSAHVVNETYEQDINDAFVEGHVALKVTGSSMVDVTFAVVDMIYKLDFDISYTADSDIKVKQSMTQTKPVSFSDPIFDSHYLEIAKKYTIGTLNFTSDADGFFANHLKYHIRFDANVASSGPIDTVLENKGKIELSLASDHWFESIKGVKVSTSTDYSALDSTGNDYQTDFYFAITTSVSSDKVGDRTSLTGSTTHASKVIYYKNAHEDSYNGKEVKHYCGIAEDGYCISSGITDKAFLKMNVDYGEFKGWDLEKTYDNDLLVRYEYNTTYNPDYNKVQNIYGDKRFIFCPFVAQKINAYVFDEDGKAQNNIGIAISDDEIKHVKEVLGEDAPLFVSAHTGEDGKAVLYLPNGTYNIHAGINYPENSGYTNWKKIRVENDSQTVIFGKAADEIVKLKVRCLFPKYENTYLEWYFPDVFPYSSEDERSSVDVSREYKWIDTNNNEINTTVDGYQYLSIDCNITNDQTAGFFADNLKVEIEDEDDNSPFTFDNFELYSVNVDADRKTAHIMIRVHTYKKDADIYEVNVINGWGNGHFEAGTTVHVISWDASLDEIADVYGPVEAQRIYAEMDHDETIALKQWVCENPEKSADLGGESNNTVASFAMPSNDVDVRASYYNATSVNRVNLKLVVPTEAGQSLQKPSRQNDTIQMFSYGEQLSIDNGISIGAAWLNSSNRDISNAIYGDQYLKMEFVFDKDMTRDNTVYRFASDVNVSLENISTRLPANEKFVLEGVYVSSDRRTLICIVKVHITPPGKTEYKLTVMDGLMSGWYEAGSRISVLSLDAYNRLGENKQEAESVIRDNIGVDARRYLMLLPDRYYKNFIEWKILEPGKNKLSQDDMEPVNTSHGSDYALSFFTMPSADVTIQGVYGEDEPVIIKYLNLSMNRPVPGQPLAAYATSTTYEVVPVFPMDDDESRFKVEWSPNVTGNAEYNKTYTASVWVKPRLMNYRFAQPIGDSAGFTAHFNYDDSVNDYQSVKNQLKLTISYTTPKAQLLKISPVNPLYYANGTSKENIDSAIKAIRANITTELGFDIADVNWNSVSETSYDPTEKERQEVKVTGTVVLPSDIQNTKTDDHEVVSQEISVTVVVLAANPKRELYPPVVSPESCITMDPLTITVTNDERNDKASRLYLISDSGKEVAYTSPIIITPKNYDQTVTLRAVVILNGERSPVVTQTYTVLANDSHRVEVFTNYGLEDISKFVDDDSLVTVKDGDTAVFKFKEPVEINEDGVVKELYLNRVYSATGNPEEVQDITDLLDKESLTLRVEKVTEDTIIRAIYSPKPYSVSAKFAENSSDFGTIDGGNKEVTKEVEDKDSVKFVLKPNADCQIEKINSYKIVNGKKVETDLTEEFAKTEGNSLTEGGTLDISNVQSDLFIEVTFGEIQIQYTVTFDANGGTNAPAAQTKIKGKDLVITSAAPRRSGYNFQGWARTNNAEKAEFKAGGIYKEDADLKLYAVWKKIETISEIEASLMLPTDEGQQLPDKDGISITAKSPSGAYVHLKDAYWKHEYGYDITVSQVGYQKVCLKVTTNGDYVFSDSVKVDVDDKSGKADYGINDIEVSKDRRTLTFNIGANVYKKDKPQYDVTVNDGFQVSLFGKYNEGDTVMLISYDILDIIEDIGSKFHIPSAIMKLIESQLPRDMIYQFESWRIDKGGDKLSYTADFTPLKPVGLNLSYAVTSFTMPACDVELTGIYSHPKEVNEFTLDFDLPVPGQSLDLIGHSKTPGIVSTLKTLDYLEMLWVPTVIGTAEYDTKYTVSTSVSAAKGYRITDVNPTAHVPSFKNADGWETADHTFNVLGQNVCTVTNSYTTPKEQLLTVEGPTEVVAFANGTPADEINKYLEENVFAKYTAQASAGTAKVKWGEVVDTSTGESGRYTYDRTDVNAQYVHDNDTDTYTVKGTMILPKGIRNEKTATHELVDTEVVVTVVINRADNDLYPPVATPESYEGYGPVVVELKDNPANILGVKRGLSFTLYRSLDDSEERIWGGGEYDMPLTLLGEEGHKATYRLVAWEYEGDDSADDLAEIKYSERVTYEYTILPKQPKEEYEVNVKGGYILLAGGKVTSATVEPGTLVTVAPFDDNDVETFTHWEWNLEEQLGDKKDFSFTMPSQNVDLKAKFKVNPLPSDRVIVETAQLEIKVPEIGEQLIGSTAGNAFEGIVIEANAAIESGETVKLTARPQPEIRWNGHSVYEPVIGGIVYDGVIKVAVDELFEPGHTVALGAQGYFSSHFMATINGEEARAAVSNDHNYVLIYFTFKHELGEYTVTVNGGNVILDGGKASSAVAEAGSLVHVAANDDTDIEKFDHWEWNVDEAAGERGFTFIMPSHDVELTAVYSIIPPTHTTVVTAGDLTIKIPQIGGMLSEQTQESSYTGFYHGKETDPVKEEVLTASPEPSITWDHDTKKPVIAGEKYTAYIRVELNQLIDEEGVALLADGYFANDFKATVNGQEVYVYVSPVNDFVLISFSFELEKEEWIVTYDANGGENAPEAQIKKANEPLIITGGKPDRYGYIFRGWSSSKDAVHPEYEAGDKYTDNYDITLYAVWEEIIPIENIYLDFIVPKPGQYLSETATSMTTGVKAPMKLMWSVDIDKKVEYDTEYTVTVLVVPMEGYRLADPIGKGSLVFVPDMYGDEGEYTLADSLVPVMENVKVTHTYRTPKAHLIDVIQPETIYFPNGTDAETINNYLADKVEIAYNSEAGSGTAKAQWGEVTDTKGRAAGRYTYDSQLKERQEVYDNQEGTYTVKGTMILPDDIRNDQDSTYDIVDTGVEICIVILQDTSTYAVSYDANGGEKAPAAQIKVAGEALKLSEQLPTFVGHKFIGWAVEKDSKKSDYQPGDMYESDQDIILYAVWEVLPGPEPIPPKPGPDPDPTPDPTPPYTGDRNAGVLYLLIAIVALLIVASTVVLLITRRNNKK